MDGDAGPGQLNSADTDGVDDAVIATEGSVEPDVNESNDDSVTSGEKVSLIKAPESESESVPDAVSAQMVAEDVETGPTETSRLSTRWIAAAAAVLVVLAGVLAGGGYLAMQSHKRTVAFAQAESQAVQAAQDCVAATQAPDPSTMMSSQQKIYDCMTGDYAVQAGLMVGVLADAYQVAQAKVEIDNLRAAVEQHLPDGTVQVLVAVQVKITNSQDSSTQGYRLRVFMQPIDGTYKISRLDQVSS
jgi:Mce-associated membrane protein